MTTDTEALIGVMIEARALPLRVAATSLRCGRWRKSLRISEVHSAGVKGPIEDVILSIECFRISVVDDAG